MSLPIGDTRVLDDDLVKDTVKDYEQQIKVLNDIVNGNKNEMIKMMEALSIAVRYMEQWRADHYKEEHPQFEADYQFIMSIVED